MRREIPTCAVHLNAVVDVVTDEVETCEVGKVPADGLRVRCARWPLGGQCPYRAKYLVVWRSKA